MAYCDFLKESGIKEGEYNLYIFGNEPDQKKVALIENHIEEIQEIISNNTDKLITIRSIQFIKNRFPDSKKRIKQELNKHKYFKELIILNSCLLNWIDDFTPEIYKELHGYSDRTHLINIEPASNTDKNDLKDKLTKLSEVASNNIGRICSITQYCSA